jgi:DNA polymerase-1
MHRYDGEPTGATLGFCNMLNKLVMTPMLKGEQPRIALIFDSKDGTNFRKELYPDYKSHRPECPEDLIPQFDFVRDAADAYGILQLEAPGYEADDVIATLSTMAMHEGCHVNILSGDKDLMQLVTKDDGGACIEMIDPMKMVRYCYDTVKEKWGVTPSQVGDVLALSGDASDNIPGVPGIGPKTAASLINEFGSLDALLENLDSIQQAGRREKLKANIETAKLSKKLVELERNVPLDIMSFPKHFDGVSDFRMEKFDRERLLSFYDRMGFKDIKKRVKSRLPKPVSKFSSFPQRFSSITDDIPSSGKSRRSKEGTQSTKGFSMKTNFIDPPKPEDFLDVPF